MTLNIFPYCSIKKQLLNVNDPANFPYCESSPLFSVVFYILIGTINTCEGHRNLILETSGDTLCFAQSKQTLPFQTSGVLLRKAKVICCHTYPLLAKNIEFGGNWFGHVHVTHFFLLLNSKLKTALLLPRKENYLFYLFDSALNCWYVLWCGKLC